MFYISTQELYDILIKLGMAFLVGGIVGAEREYKNKTAGFRTLILICIGAMLFTVLGIKINPVEGTRLIANVVVGIGFLGAGVIFKDNSKVTGMTTAATIWATAALGVCIGIGYYTLAIIITGSIIIVLLLFSRFEAYIDNNHHIRQYEIKSHPDNNFIPFIEEEIAHCQLKIETKNISKEDYKMVITFRLAGHPTAHDSFVEKLLQSDVILSFKSSY